MTTTPTSTAIALAEPMFSNAERLALAGFLTGYTGGLRSGAAAVRELVPAASPAPVPGPAPCYADGIHDGQGQWPPNSARRCSR